MSISELRDAFNLVAEPAHTCSRAYLDYKREFDDKLRKTSEYQVLTFFGTSLDGNTFEVKSANLPAGKDLQVAARETARGLTEGTP